MGSDRRLEWSLASRPAVGSTVSGDAELVLDLGNRTLLAVVDGLGHGPAAAAATAIAVTTIRDCAGETLDRIVNACHEAMTSTRGAAITVVAVFDDGRLDWLAVGNVEAAIIRGGRVTTGSVETVYHFAGVVGQQVPTLHVLTSHVIRGDVLVMHTDGVTADFLTDSRPLGSSAAVADRIQATYGRDGDDALVVVARVR